MTWIDQTQKTPPYGLQRAWQILRVPGFRDPQTQGILCILGAVALLSLSDAIVKAQDGSVGLGQLLFLRSGFALVIIFIAAFLSGRLSALWPQNAKAVAVRSLCLGGMWLSYYASLPLLPLPVAAAGFYTSPFFMALFTVLLTREKVGANRWLIVLCGIGGVLLMLRPTESEIPWPIGLAVLAAALYALAALVTRGGCRHESVWSLAFCLNWVLVLLGAGLSAGLWAFPPPDTWQDAAPFLLTGWREVDGPTLLLMLGLGVLLALICGGVAKAYQSAPAPVVGVFDNFYVIFAGFWAVVLFSQQFELLDYAAIAMISLSGGLAAFSRGSASGRKL
ncbi:DMT family transporter [Roseibium sp.]|uniref:DMT family transporter n=1 Tax=Roseibium sp. TaxID=1936156 RepID=UPI003A96D823